MLSTKSGQGQTKVYLPAKDIESVTENEQALTKIAGVKSAKMEAGRAVLEVGSGDYHFVARW